MKNIVINNNGFDPKEVAKFESFEAFEKDIESQRSKDNPGFAFGYNTPEDRSKLLREVYDKSVSVVKGVTEVAPPPPPAGGKSKPQS